MKKIFLDCFKDNHKVAEADISDYTIDDIIYLAMIQERQGREIKIRREGEKEVVS